MKNISVDKKSGHTIHTSFSGEKFDLTKFLSLRNDYRDLHVHLEIESDLTREERKPLLKELRELRSKLDLLVYQGQERIPNA